MVNREAIVWSSPLLCALCLPYRLIGVTGVVAVPFEVTDQLTIGYWYPPWSGHDRQGEAWLIVSKELSVCRKRGFYRSAMSPSTRKASPAGYLFPRLPLPVERLWYWMDTNRVFDLPGKLDLPALNDDLEGECDKGLLYRRNPWKLVVFESFGSGLCGMYDPWGNNKGKFPPNRYSF